MIANKKLITGAAIISALALSTMAFASEETSIRLGGMNGPTSMGMSKLLHDASNGECAVDLDFTLTTPDELTPQIIQGNLDIAAIPANLASVLYNKTEGEISVLAINTLGVLSIVDTGDSIQSLEDLKGKTLYATGQGTTPEYSLSFLLSEAGIDLGSDVTVEWKSEAAEIVAVMSEAEDEVIAMLPQPFVTVAQTQVEGLRVAVDLNEEWNALDNGSRLVTGVIIARNEFIEANPELVSDFLDAYSESISFVNENTDEAAVYVGELDIVKEPIAKKALPNCNITYMEGDEMQEAVSGYLAILHEKDPASVGGKLPEDDFYFHR